MTIKDFFTLTEMSNGLAAPARVKELVAVMQESGCPVKNVGEAARQWSAVARAIAATENQECLDLFIQLDGLHFIGKWLKDAQKLENDSNDNFVEESITHLLEAIGKLHVDCKNLVASEIWTTVRDLLVHNNSEVQDKAQVLFESWKRGTNGNTSLSDAEGSGALTDDDMGKSADIERGIGHPESSQRVDSLSRETSCREKGQESSRDNAVLSASPDAVLAGKVKNEQNLDENSNHKVGDDELSNHVGSPSLVKPAMELLACHSIGAASTKTCKPAVSGHITLDGGMDFHEVESGSDAKHNPKIETSPEKSGSLEELNTSEDIPTPSNSDAADARKSATEPISQKFPDAEDKILCNEGSAYIDSKKTDLDGNSFMDDICSANQCRNSSAAKEGDEFEGRILCKSSGTETNQENTLELGVFMSEIEDHEKIDKLGQHVSSDDLTNDYKFAKKLKVREPDQAGKKSDAELYGIEDPLEVARQVAIEVEREFVDYREQSCDASEKLPEGNVHRPDSPNIVGGKESQTSETPPKDVASDPDLSAETSPMQEKSSPSTEDLDAEQTNGMQDVATSQVTEVAPEEDSREKELCSFDLNQEACSEDADRPENQLPPPMSIVSASRAAAAHGWPVAPSQFEGNLGWKGSATTSAFHPASSRRMPESEKDLYDGGIGCSSRELGCLDIDLNMAESVDGQTECLLPEKNVPSHSGLPSGESFANTNPRSEHLELDLNLMNDDGTCPSGWQMGHFFPQGNGKNSQSHSSTSSKQPSLKNIDLNDQPSFLNNSTNNSYVSKLSQNFTGGVKSNDPGISIMGKRVEINHKDFPSQNAALLNGRTSDIAFDVNLGRTGGFLGLGSVLPYGHSSVYGCSNIAPESAMPFSSAIHGSRGPVNWMVDSRGAPVMPQIAASASVMPTSFAQTPFFINMSSPTPSNEVGAAGPSRSSFDLNSGMKAEGGSKDPTGFAQFLSLGQVRSMDEQLRSNSQLTIGSAVGGKRKEPANGWEHYPSKHCTPPWK